jgi:hypothetical protein
MYKLLLTKQSAEEISLESLMESAAEVDASSGTNGVHVVCRELRIDVLSRLLSAKRTKKIAKLAASSNVAGYTALHACVMRCAHRLDSKHRNDNDDNDGVDGADDEATKTDRSAAACLDALLSNAAVRAAIDINAVCAARHETALLMASKYGALACVQVLTKFKCDVDLADRDGNEPIYHAWRRQFSKVCHVLVTSKADVRQMYALREVALADDDDDKQLLEQVAAADTFGFLEDRQAAPPAYINSSARQQKWADMLHHRTKTGKWPAKFAKRLGKGVPSACRGAVWMQALDVPVITAKLTAQYETLCETRMPQWGEQLDVDVLRESRTHEMFHERYGRGQRMLFRVLWALTAEDAELGYCQGMSGIAAMLLFWLDEMSAFAAMRHMMRARHMRTLYLRGFPLLEQLGFFHTGITALPSAAPQLRATLDKNGIVPEVYCTEWFLKVMYQRLPFAAAVHVWDHYCAYGYEAVLAATLACMQFFEPTHGNKSIEEIMQAFQNAGNADSPITYELYVPLFQHALTTVRRQLPKLSVEWTKTHNDESKPLEKCIFQ